MDVSKIRKICLGGYSISKIPEAASQKSVLLKLHPLNKDESELLHLLEKWFAAKKKPHPYASNLEGYEAEDEMLQKHLNDALEALHEEQKSRWPIERRQKEEIENYPGKFVRGTIFEIVGTRFAHGRGGNRYEVVVRDVIFDEWNEQELVLGDRISCIDSQYSRDPLFYRHEGPRIPSHFFIIIRRHRRWGIFVPCNEAGQYPEISDIEKTLAWYRRDGEQPKIENDDPGTYHYQSIVVNGVELDLEERIKH